MLHLIVLYQSPNNNDVCSISINTVFKNSINSIYIYIYIKITPSLQHPQMITFREVVRGSYPTQHIKTAIRQRVTHKTLNIVFTSREEVIEDIRM